MTVDRQARRVAVLSDVHGNAVALEAVLDAVRAERPDVVVFGGDLTWGPQPRETIALARSLELPTMYVRGNAERTLLEGPAEGSPRQAWLADAHGDDGLAFVATAVAQVAIEVAGLGPTLVCHGSPRSDEELVTPETPEERIRELCAAIGERVLVTAHTHLQFDRRVAGIRSVNAGSVGVPYEPERGAYWALLGPDVELRRTGYDLDRAVAAYRASGDPDAERMIALLRSPPTRAEVIEHAERLVFSS